MRTSNNFHPARSRKVSRCSGFSLGDITCEDIINAYYVSKIILIDAYLTTLVVNENTTATTLATCKT